jgi:hypothetical protein
MSPWVKGPMENAQNNRCKQIWKVLWNIEICISQFEHMFETHLHLNYECVGSDVELFLSSDWLLVPSDASLVSDDGSLVSDD